MAWRRAVVAVLAAGPVVVASGRDDGFIANSGFESGGFVIGYTGAVGVWFGDRATIVAAEGGIEPLSGVSMLRFDSAGEGACGAGGTTAEVLQWVDVGALAAQIDAGGLAVRIEAWWNRVAGDRTTDTLFVPTVYPHESVQAGFAGLYDAPFSSGGLIQTDADTVTWQSSSSRVVLPIGTRFVAVRVAADENVQNDQCEEFDGHYVDEVSLAFSCAPDLNFDGVVDSADLNLLLAAFGGGGGGDLDGDALTTSADLNVLLAAFGGACGG